MENNECTTGKPALFINKYISNINTIRTHEKNPRGLDTPARVTILALNNANLNELKGQATPLEAHGNYDRSRNKLKLGKYQRASIGWKTPWRLLHNNREKFWPCGQHFPTSWVRSGYEARLKFHEAVLLDQSNYLDIHSMHNLNKIIRNSLEITKLLNPGSFTKSFLLSTMGAIQMRLWNKRSNIRPKTTICSGITYP